MSRIRNSEEQHQAILHNTDVYWMGLKGTLYDMHREGWDVVIDYRSEMDAVQVVMYNKKMSSYYLAQMFDMQHIQSLSHHALGPGGLTYFADGGDYAPNRLRMNISHYVADAVIQIQADVRSWKDTELIPAYGTREKVKLSDLQLFDEGKDEPTIIKPESVPELMAKILQLQEPNQAEIRKKIQKERRQVTHQAKIISLAG